MLYALGDPFSFVVLVVSFTLAVTLHGWLQCLLAVRTGDRRPRDEGRTVPDPRRHLDPFGTVAGAIAGMGWSKPLEETGRRSRGALLTVFLVPSLVNIALGLGCLLGARALLGAPLPVSSLLLQNGIGGASYGVIALLLLGLMNLYVGALSLVPLPPLDGGRLLFGLAPRTLGWQKAEHQLVERNIGLVAVMVLLLLPLGGPQALLPKVLDDLLAPLVRVLTGG